jgi:ABC-type antimicrobial peptide transport system permease subunit|tara:strand:- start:20 stop:202 length:183 start_codon:yes stop_codon:yes gene_type:complete
MVVAYSPPLVAMALSKLSGDKMSWRWPFQKDAIVGSFGFFVFAGWLVCVLPIYHALKWLL